MSIDVAAVEPYASSVVRAFNLPTPRVGQGSFLVDTGAVEFYYGARLGWRPPWNVGWGEVARVVDENGFTLLSTASEVEIATSRLTITNPGNRLYRIRTEALLASLDSVAAAATLRFRWGTGNGLGTQIEDRLLVSTADLASAHEFDVPFAMTREIGSTLPQGVQVIQVTLQPGSASGVGISIDGSNLAPMVTTIDDIGPSGGPAY